MRALAEDGKSARHLTPDALDTAAREVIGRSLALDRGCPRRRRWTPRPSSPRGSRPAVRRPRRWTRWSTTSSSGSSRRRGGATRRLARFAAAEAGLRANVRVLAGWPAPPDRGGERVTDAKSTDVIPTLPADRGRRERGLVAVRRGGRRTRDTRWPSWIGGSRPGATQTWSAALGRLYGRRSALDRLRQRRGPATDRPGHTAAGGGRPGKVGRSPGSTTGCSSTAARPSPTPTPVTPLRRSMRAAVVAEGLGRTSVDAADRLLSRR